MDYIFNIINIKNIIHSSRIVSEDPNCYLLFLIIDQFGYLLIILYCILDIVTLKNKVIELLGVSSIW